MTREQLIEEYTMLVRRCPDMPNREIAQKIGMTETGMERALTRARAGGQLTIRRRCVGGFGNTTRIEMAP